MRKFIFTMTIALCTFSSAHVLAQNTESTTKVGTTAAQFLKIGIGARQIALGSAVVALDEGIESIAWNPALIARVGGTGEAAFNHADWLVDTDLDFAAFSINLGSMGTFGAHIVSFRVPEEKVRTVRFPEGTGQVWDANSIAIGLTFARSLTDRFAIGITGKYVQESIFNETARSAAVDLGVFYHTPWKSLKLGASITNFGGKMRLEGRDIFFNEDPILEEGPVDQVPAKYRLDSYELPLGLRFGIAWEALRNDNLRVLVLVDGNHPNDSAEYVNTGMEVSLNRIIFLRGGFKTLFLDDSEQGLTFGGGLRYDVVGTNFRLDFGYADFGRLESVQFVSFSIGY